MGFVKIYTRKNRDLAPFIVKAKFNPSMTFFNDFMCEIKLKKKY